MECGGGGTLLKGLSFDLICFLVILGDAIVGDATVVLGAILDSVDSR